MHGDSLKVLSIHTQQLAAVSMVMVGEVRGRGEGELWTAVVRPWHLALPSLGHAPPACGDIVDTCGYL